MDQMVIKPHPDKTMIPLSIGDPTKFGNFPPPSEAIMAVQTSLTAGNRNGYAKSTGYDDAREALAKHYGSVDSHLGADDVVIASGCSGALDIAIGVIADEGDNILIPAPGFSLYKTLSSARGVSTRSYRCLAEKRWEIDLDHMASLVDDRTRAILLTNPSNPCGSNFSREHIVEILQVAERFKLPIIADEIYNDMVFSGAGFTSVASVSRNVPVLACGGLAKRFMAPGWRVGWVLVHDRHGIFAQEVKPAVINMSMLVLGACTVVQAAIPAMLTNVPDAYHQGNLDRLRAAATLCYEMLSKVPGLSPVMPEAAMYIMVGIDLDAFPDIKNDRDFCQKLIEEESVFPLPGEVFEGPGFFRIVTTVPLDKLTIAMDRIAAFCKAHHV